MGGILVGDVAVSPSIAEIYRCMQKHSYTNEFNLHSDPSELLVCRRCALFA